MIKATIILGQDAVTRYKETGKLLSEQWLMDNGGIVDEKEFRTKAEYDAYAEALSDSDGWDDYEIIKQNETPRFVCPICGISNCENQVDTDAESSVWMRLGITVTGSKEDIEKILQGDEAALASLLKKKKFNIDGETYIPSSCIEEYNSQNKTSFEEEDIEFHSLNM